MRSKDLLVLSKGAFLVCMFTSLHARTRQFAADRSAFQILGLACAHGMRIGSIKVDLQCDTINDLPSEIQHNQQEE